MANLRRLLDPIKSPEARRYTEVMERIGESQDTYGGQNRLFREINRYYLSLSPVAEGRDNDRPLMTGREPETDVFVGEMFAVVESATPNWLFGMFGNRPYVRVMGRTKDDHDKKDGVEMMLDYDFSQANVFLESIPVAKSLFKYGTGIAQVTYDWEGYFLEEEVEHPYPNGFDRIGNLLLGWKRGKRKRLVTEFDGPKVEWISIFNFGVDPLYWRLRDMRYCWKRRWTDRGTLKWENARYHELTGKALYKNLDKIPITKSTDVEEIYQMDGSDDTSEAMGWSPAKWKRQPYAQIREIARIDDQAVEVLEYWERDGWVQVANGETTIHDGPNPYADKRLPFVMPKCYELEGYPWGFGLGHAIKSEQEELNSWRNLILRQARFNVLNVWAVEEDVELPPHADQLGPGDVIQIPFSSSGKPLTQNIYEGKPLPPEAYEMEDRIRSDIQRKLAYSEGMMFGQAGGASETATGQRMAGQGTVNRFRLQNAIGDFTYLREIAKFFYSRRQQFFKEEEVFRIIGKEGVKFEKLTPEEIAGNFDYEPLGQTLAPNRDVLRQQMIEVIALIKGDPVFLERTDIDELWLELWKLFDQQFPERFVLKPPAKQWTPEIENAAIMAGQFVDVDANEDHTYHRQVHQQVFAQAAGDPKAIKAAQEHDRKHQMYEAAMNAQRPQEMPGRAAQYAGERPPSQPAAMTQGALESRVGGGTSG